MNKLFLLFSIFIVAGCGKKGGEDWAASKPKSISGKITILPGLESKINSKAVIFVMAKGEQGGPPIAVKKIEISSFPISYTLSEEKDLMLPGMIFPEKMNVTARVDQDGNASPAQPGDLEGEYPDNPALIEKGEINIEISKLY